MKQIWKAILMMITLMVMSCIIASAEKTLATDVTKASSGCQMVGIAGEYLFNADGALASMNEIRREACENGYKNPATGKKLTMKDYVPLKWSSDMEYIAKIRAAESSITMAHVRTNGKSCFALKSPNGKKANCECIAWNFGKDPLHGIEQWYREKDAYVKKTGGVTGHYEAIIDPTLRYVAVASFYSESALYYNTTIAEFSTAKSGLSTKKGSNSGSIIQKLEMKSSYLNSNRARLVTLSTSLSVSAVKAVIQKGKKATLTVTNNTGKKVTFTSSNKKIATVTTKGVIKGVKKGTCTITVKAGSEKKTVKITVK